MRATTLETAYARHQHSRFGVFRIIELAAHVDRQVHARGAERLEAQVRTPLLHVLLLLKTLDLAAAGEHNLRRVRPYTRSQFREVR